MFWHLRSFYLAPEGDIPVVGAGTGVADPAPDPTPEAKFSDKDMAAIRRKHEREIKIRDKQLEEQAARLTTLENPPEPPAPIIVDPADKSAGELELQQKRHLREMEAARGDAAEARKIAESERQKRRDVERSRSLSDALSLAGVADKAKEYAIDHFTKKIIWDEIDGAWVYKTKQGNLVDIADGITEEMPDMFKRPAATRGGAGTQSGLPPTRARLAAQLESEQQKLASLKALGGRNTSNVLAFTKQERIVRNLESRVNAT